jgi:predicted transcriptional regulator
MIEKNFYAGKTVEELLQLKKICEERIESIQSKIKEESMSKDIEHKDIEHRPVLLQRLGLSRCEASILHSLLFGNPLNGRTIEREMNLRQPEISLGSNALIERGWIRVIYPKSHGRGRPEKVFEMAVSGDQIIEELKASWDKKRAKNDMLFEELHNIMKE